MGIEPTSSVPQVCESTHRSISIWARLGAEFWPQQLAHLVHCISLRITDHMTVDSQRNSRIRVSHLLFRDRRIRSYFYEQTRVAMPEWVAPAQASCHAAPKSYGRQFSSSSLC